MSCIRNLLMAFGLVLAIATPALAYVGPGAGLTAIGAALAFVAGILLAIVGFVWYPLKRLWRAASRRRDTAADTAADEAPV